MEEIDVSSGTYTEEERTLGLRFVQREGRFILQQCWSIIERSYSAWPVSRMEWRDVPLEAEE